MNLRQGKVLDDKKEEDGAFEHDSKVLKNLSVNQSN